MTADGAPVGAAVPPPPGRRPLRGALAVAAVVWTGLLVTLGWSSATRDAPTAREQRDVAQAAPVVDEATVALAAAARALGAAFALAPARLTPCRLHLFRDGQHLRRDLTLTPPGGDAVGLLRGLRARLPARYDAVLHGGDGAELTADAGGFVAVTAHASGPAAAATVGTGCRPAAPGYVPAPAAPVESPLGRLSGVLGVLGGGAAAAERVAVRAPDGRVASSTTAVVAAGVPDLAVTAAMGPPLPGSPPRWLGAGGEVLVARDGDGLRVTRCRYATGE
ncbi:MAG TPA: hypothetical protein VFY17_06195 [Pilimelia sp.]|nr:hypothetical protein [Pilimelia sp.]